MHRTHICGQRVNAPLRTLLCDSTFDGGGDVPSRNISIHFVRRGGKRTHVVRSVFDCRGRRCTLVYPFAAKKADALSGERERESEREKVGAQGRETNVDDAAHGILPSLPESNLSR